MRTFRIIMLLLSAFVAFFMIIGIVKVARAQETIPLGNVTIHIVDNKAALAAKFPNFKGAKGIAVGNGHIYVTKGFDMRTLGHELQHLMNWKKPLTVSSPHSTSNNYRYSNVMNVPQIQYRKKKNTSWWFESAKVRNAWFKNTDKPMWPGRKKKK